MPVFGIEFSAQWMSEQFIRKYMVFMSINNGLNLHQTSERVTMTCRRKHCKTGTKFQPSNRTEVQRMISFSNHLEFCRGWGIFDKNGTENDIWSISNNYITCTHTLRNKSRPMRRTGVETQPLNSYEDNFVHHLFKRYLLKTGIPNNISINQKSINARNAGCKC